MVHPFDQLTPDEAKKAVAILRKANKDLTLHIKNISTQEPPKHLMTEYLQAEHAGMPIKPPPRVAYTFFYTLEEKQSEEMWLDLDSEKVLKRQVFPAGSHATFDPLEG